MNNRDKHSDFPIELRSVPPELPAVLAELADEVRRNRSDFPCARHLFAFLVNEVGELADVLLKGDQPEAMRAKAKQVACLAIRIMSEGDSAFD